VATKLIELNDKTLIEVEVPPDQAKKISGGFADKVDANLDKIKPILLNACLPIVAAWQEIGEKINLDHAEVELGLSFEGEGNLYITKAKAGANINVKVVFKLKE